MNRERRIGIGVLVGLAAFVAFVILVGGLGETRPDVDPYRVDEVLEGERPPADRLGSEELHIVGWYAELDADCEGDEGGADASVAWLQRECPLRVLLAEQPPEGVTQEELERSGIRLAAPLGSVFPSRAEGGGPNLRGQPLVFIGHFADPAAASCTPERRERCESTFVVTDYDGLLR